VSQPVFTCLAYRRDERQPRASTKRSRTSGSVDEEEGEGKVALPLSERCALPLTECHAHGSGSTACQTGLALRGRADSPERIGPRRARARSGAQERARGSDAWIGPRGASLGEPFESRGLGAAERASLQCLRGW
jgi:hypothetical protein